MVRLRFLHSTFFMKICANFINQMSVNSQYPSRKQTRNVCNFDITLLLCYTHCTFQYVFLCCGVERESSRCWCVVVAYECNEEKEERESWIRFCFLRYCTPCTSDTEWCWKYKSSDSFFFACTYCIDIVILYLVAQ